jgi:chromosome transmission fidelity protein 8
VGYHELAGTKVTLKKPLLVLRKKMDAGCGEQEPPAAVAEVELEVIGMIRHKILFKDRPKALISSNPLNNPLLSLSLSLSLSSFA